MIQRKRTGVLLTVLMVFVLALAACVAPQPATAPAASSGDSAAISDIKIGLVTDVGRVNDRSFNQSAWEGVKQAGAALGLTEGEGFKYIETQDPKDYANNIQQFVDAEYNIIVSVGFALGEATATAAKANPGIHFIGVDQFQAWGFTEDKADDLANVTGLIFHEDQSGFLAGALAAQMTKSGTIAAVLGTDLVPPVVAFKEGYELGAKYINPDIKLISSYHPGELSQAFVDPEWGAATAKQAIDQGADVIFGAGGLTGNGALQEVAAHEGILCIGVDTDQWETLEAAHPCLISSAMKLITPGVVDIVSQIKDGKAPAGNYFGGAALAPFHDFDAQIPQEVKDKLIEIDKGLKDGSLKTGYGQ